MTFECISSSTIIMIITIIITIEYFFIVLIVVHIKHCDVIKEKKLYGFKKNYSIMNEVNSIYVIFIPDCKNIAVVR